MNHYLSTMSEPIRKHKGIIDKYIGDGIMAYWGPPFTDEKDHARLACLAAIEMIDHVAALRTEIPELLGVRSVSSDCDLRVGIATGEVLVGSIGSEFMMSYTVMGDPVTPHRVSNAQQGLWKPFAGFRRDDRRRRSCYRGSRNRSCDRIGTNHGTGDFRDYGACGRT